MKTRNNRLSGKRIGGQGLLAGLFVCLLLGPSAFAKGDANSTCKASFVKGQVEVGATADGPFKKLKRNRKVMAGSFVKTHANARVELKFKNGSVLRIGPSSMMRLAGANINSESSEVQVDATLIGGKAWANVAKMVGSESSFEVKTENAVAGVRGTVFRVDLDKDKATVVKVYNGAVAVSNSPFFSDKPSGSKSLAPIDPKRQQIASPFQEISKKEWEQVVQRMMVVKVGGNGDMSQAMAFSQKDDKMQDPDWVNWNLACDSGNCDAY
jgi:hypothetical protein